MSGILIGFYRISNYLNFYGIKTFILPVILSIVVKEYLRYQMLNKAENSKLFIAITTLAFSFLDISNAFNYESFATSYDIFLFIALFVLPSLSTNATCSYIAIKTGYKPNIMWLLFVMIRKKLTFLKLLIFGAIGKNLKFKDFTMICLYFLMMIKFLWLAATPTSAW